MMSVNVMVTPYEKGSLKGLASVNLGTSVRMNGITIRENSNGELFVSMPSYKASDGSWKEHFHPITKSFKETLDQKILLAYDAKTHGRAEKKEAVREPEITDVRVTEFQKDNIRGLGTVILDGAFVMNGIKVMEGRYGMFAGMPSYRGTDGNFHDYIEVSGDFKKAMVQSLVSHLQNPPVKAGPTESTGTAPYRADAKPSPEQAAKEGFLPIEDDNKKTKPSKVQAKQEKAKRPDTKQAAKQQPVKVM